MPEFHRVAAVEELPPGGALAVKVNGHAVALRNVDGVLHAVDNRCPHMGYPLVDAPLEQGVLRCPWHHWRFELRTGGCLTGGGDDLGTFEVEVRDGAIYVAGSPRDAGLEARRERARRDLEQGLVEASTFLIAKGLCALRATQVDDRAILRQVVEHGLRYRAEGFGPGLVILTALLNTADRLADEDRLLALVHGVTQLARDSANRAPRRPLRPLPGGAAPGLEELRELFRRMIEDREAAGAERLLRTALAGPDPERAAACLLLPAATDHYFLSTGHVLDFINKAFELTDQAGAELRDELLASLVRPLAGAFRHDESADWQPAVAPLEAAFQRLAQRPPSDPAWRDDRLVELLLGGEPEPIVHAISGAIDAGAGPRALAGELCRAAFLRVARFHLQNENDWDDVLHLASYCHAVERLAVRFGDLPACAEPLYKAIFHGAVYCHLTRFLNVPAVPLPGERDRGFALPSTPEALCERLLWCAEYQQVEEAAAVAHAYLAAGWPSGPLASALLAALLREDSVFHTFQMVEAGLARHAAGDGALPLIAAARYLTAQKLRRGVLWSTRNAQTLARGEGLNTRPSS